MNKKIHPNSINSAPKPETKTGEGKPKTLEYSAIYIYQLDPFVLLDAVDSKIRREITGSNDLEKLPENDQKIIEESTQEFSYEDKLVQVRSFFLNNPKGEWRDVLTLRTSTRQPKLFVVSATAYSVNREGQVESIKVDMDMVPFDKSSVKELNKAVARHNKLHYKPLIDKLTKTEFKVFKELVSGNTIVEIADKFCRSKYTIESHSAKIKKKLDCKNIAEVVKIGIKIGILE